MCNSLRLLTQANQSKTPTHGPETEQLRQMMLASSSDYRLCLGARCRELASPNVQHRGEPLCDGDAVGLREASAKVHRCVDHLQSLVRGAQEP